MMHEFQMVVTGIAGDMIASNKKFSTDYRRALGNVGLQCEDKICMTVLGLVGTALGYASWLEICASVAVLLVYFRIRPDERMAYGDITAIAVDAPAMPEEIEAMRKEGRQKAAGSSTAAARRHAAGQLMETKTGPVVVSGSRRGSSRLRLWLRRVTGRHSSGASTSGSSAVSLESAAGVGSYVPNVPGELFTTDSAEVHVRPDKKGKVPPGEGHVIIPAGAAYQAPSVAHISPDTATSDQRSGSRSEPAGSDNAGNSSTVIDMR
jgi:hypothetical protein